jgi:hypothetical protein
VQNLLTDLHVWYESVPREGRALQPTKAAASTASQPSHRHIAICTAYQYREAVLAVLSLLNQLPSLKTSASSLTLRLPGSAAPCSPAAILLGSIKGVLTLSHHVSDILDDR